MRTLRLQNGHVVVSLRGVVLPPDVAGQEHTWEAAEVDPRALLEPHRWAVIVDVDERIHVVRCSCLPLPGTVTLGALVAVRSPVPRKD